MPASPVASPTTTTTTTTTRRPRPRAPRMRSSMPTETIQAGQRSERGRTLDALAIAAKPLFIGPLRPHEYLAARDAAERLIRHAEYLMLRFLEPRLHVLGIVPGSPDDDDLQQFLRIETFRSVSRYNPAYAFSTYLMAGCWRKAIDTWRKQRSVIRVSAHVAMRGAEHCRDGTRTQAMIDRENDARRALRTLSIDVPDGDGGSIAEAIPSRGDVDREILTNEIHRRVDEALETLPERMREIVAIRLFTIGPDRHLSVLGRRYEISKERVRQIEYEGMQRLRKALADLAVGLKDAPE